MAINLWNRAKREQMTRRGERSNDPARVQRLTDLLHLVRERGESAETAISYALEFLTGPENPSDRATVRNVLRAHVARYDVTRPSEDVAQPFETGRRVIASRRTARPISALMDPPMPVLTRRTIATADPLPVSPTWDEIPDCNCDGCVAYRRDAAPDE